MAPELIAIARIAGPHGVKGQVRVVPLTDFPEHLLRVRRAFIGDPPRPVGVRFSGTARGMPLCAVEGVADRDAAMTLRGQLLRLPREELAPLPEGHFYVFELVGLAVLSTEGERLGTLVDVESGAAADLYVVELPDGRRVRVPAVRAFVKAVEPAAGRIVIAPIPGLLE